jgi:hypothetical protein
MPITSENDMITLTDDHLLLKNSLNTLNFSQISIKSLWSGTEN